METHDAYRTTINGTGHTAGKTVTPTSTPVGVPIVTAHTPPHENKQGPRTQAYGGGRAASLLDLRGLPNPFHSVPAADVTQPY